MDYIADKDLYSAVMFACSMIREHGGQYFKIAIKKAAGYYQVDRDDVEKYVRQRQADGRRKSSKTKGIKYKYYAIESSEGGERSNGAYFEPKWAVYSVAKATNKTNAMKQLSKGDDWSEYGTQTWFGRVEEFSTRQEAEACIRNWKERAKR